MLVRVDPAALGICKNMTCRLFCCGCFTLHLPRYSNFSSAYQNDFTTIYRAKPVQLVEGPPARHNPNIESGPKDRNNSRNQIHSWSLENCFGFRVSNFLVIAWRSLRLCAKHSFLSDLSSVQNINYVWLFVTFVSLSHTGTRMNDGILLLRSTFPGLSRFKKDDC
jgi:hypothetical protein